PARNTHLNPALADVSAAWWCAARRPTRSLQGNGEVLTRWARGVLMRRSCTVIVVVLAATMGLIGCNDYGNTFQGNTGAFLQSLSPDNFPAGGSDLRVTVNGGGFVAKTVVK